MTRTGGVEQEAVNQISGDLYGESDFSPYRVALLGGRQAAASLAGELVFHAEPGHPAVWDLLLESTAGDAATDDRYSTQNLSDHVIPHRAGLRHRGSLTTSSR